VIRKAPFRKTARSKQQWCTERAVVREPNRHETSHERHPAELRPASFTM